MLKGSVLGPMVICGICFPKSNLEFLTKIDVKDSKKLSPKRRTELAKLLKTNCHSHKIIELSPEEIDNRLTQKITLNRLEELKMADIINDLKPDVIILDAADVNEERFGDSIKKLLRYHPKTIISKHKADDKYPIVSASSIIAKDKRDFLIREACSKYGEFGSGYPSDGRTIEFLLKYVKKNKKLPKIARKSWETTKKIINEEISNKKISEFF
ncbi:MAG: ribonuclease HII [Candidatus Thorarchaeota archaeon]